MVLSPSPLALWVLPVADLGGVARHAVDVARATIPGFRTVFLVPDGPVVGVLGDVGAEVRVERFGPAAGLVASIGALRRVTAELRPAVVHTHLAYADLVAASVRPVLGGARLVSTEHGIAADDLVYHRRANRARGMAALHRWRLRRTDALVTVSHATLEAVQQKWHPPARLPRHVVPNGVDRPAEPAPLRAPEPGRPLHVVSLARLAAEKRLPQLLAGFAALRETRPAARLTLAGDGPLAEHLRGEVHRLGLTDHVALPGHVPPGPLLAEADVLALLSVWENCPYAVLDALAHGVGVVASAVGGHPELLPSRCLVDPADPASVAAALLRQGASTDERPRLGSQWPTTGDMARQLAAIYREVW